ncbi:hypothetical protein DES32_3193 [Methylovirgula ligni]|uniref:Uncharacterized protein n=1 Tax=Methylovirgula ligni TaxID=569860 RepID=A0A3D9YL21_9HYPH|nr:hypothetical protein [Methylovirgula ligni]REF83277.1 hypothetical protein DES32_3193 [Methylovirgula ligni]
MPFPKPAAATDRETLEEIARLWADPNNTKQAIAERYGYSVGWLDRRLDEARNMGFAVFPRAGGRGAASTFTDELVQLVATLVADKTPHNEIMRRLGKDSSWVSHAKYLARHRGFDVAAAPEASAKTPSDLVAGLRVTRRRRGGITITLPYLRCLDPEARRV